MWADAQHEGRPADYIGGALCESSVTPLLVPCCKVWLMPAAGVLCNNAANIEGKTWMQSEFYTSQKFRQGARAPKNVYTVYQPRRWPNVVQSLVERRHCSNEAKT